MSDLNELDLLQQAFTQESDVTIIVKAEDMQYEGIDWALTFFEPQPNKSYTIKFVQNVEGDGNLIHRKVYKRLPDPKRRGKTFQYVSTDQAATSKPLDLFFKLNKLAKDGNPLAQLKIDDFLSQTNQACSVIQILSSDDTTEIGQFRLFSFSNFGQNAHVANLLNEKLNPTKQQIENGYAKEDIYNIFGSSALLLECVESVFDGNKGRDYSKSSWSKNVRGVKIPLEDGTIHEFNKEKDMADGKIKPEVLPAFKALIEALKNPQISIHNYFAHKEFGDPRNTKETDDYVKLTNEKVDEIIPIIEKAMNLNEVKTYGVEDNTSTTTTNDSAKTISGDSTANILLESMPTELDNSVMNEQPTETKTDVVLTETNVPGGDDINDILMG